MSYHTGLQVLRAKLRGFHAAGSTLSSRISTSHKERKSRLWNQKRSLGVHCRYHLVAYGLLRGVPYHQIERCAPTNRLDPKRLLAIIEEHNQWTPERGFVRYDVDAVTKLLDASSPSTTAPAAEVTGHSRDYPLAVGAPAACQSSMPNLLDRARSLLRKGA